MTTPDKKQLNPYAGLPPRAYWREAVARVPWNSLDPLTETWPIISRTSPIASAGSCFAQHVAGFIQKSGYRYLILEDGAGLFSANYGNIYTVRQLLQLFKRAAGLMAADPSLDVWEGPDGLLIDAYRPTVAGPWADQASLEAARAAHLKAVRLLFAQTEVFIFTLGLTECWGSKAGGLVFPVAPGVLNRNFNPDHFSFLNLNVSEIIADFNEFVELARRLNPALKIILTVSPVPLTATYRPEHVLVANCHSKSVLRVAAQQIVDSQENIFYFPSYEIFTGIHTGGRFYQPNLREVTPAGVALAMRCFRKHFMADGPEDLPGDYAAGEEAPCDLDLLEAGR